MSILIVSLIDKHSTKKGLATWSTLNIQLRESKVLFSATLGSPMLQGTSKNNNSAGIAKASSQKEQLYLSQGSIS